MYHRYLLPIPDVLPVRTIRYKSRILLGFFAIRPIHITPHWKICSLDRYGNILLEDELVLCVTVDLVQVLESVRHADGA